MIVNVWGSQDADLRERLNVELLKLTRCDGSQCWRRQRTVPSLN
jgi:hypothetical protein